MNQKEAPDDLVCFQYSFSLELLSTTLTFFLILSLSPGLFSLSILFLCQLSVTPSIIILFSPFAVLSSLPLSLSVTLSLLLQCVPPVIVSPINYNNLTRQQTNFFYTHHFLTYSYFFLLSLLRCIPSFWYVTNILSSSLFCDCVCVCGENECACDLQ